jgi:hypothetical protein
LKAAIFPLIILLVVVFNIPIGLTNLISYAQRDQPSISGGGRFANPGSKIEPSDISNANTTTLSNPQLVIKLLSSMAPDDISTFPLKNIPKDELLIVLNGLSVQDLFKTLDNIPAADLAGILNKLPQDKNQAILNRLPSDQSQEIQDRLTVESLK